MLSVKEKGGNKKLGGAGLTVASRKNSRKIKEYLAPRNAEHKKLKEKGRKKNSEGGSPNVTPKENKKKSPRTPSHNHPMIKKTPRSRVTITHRGQKTRRAKK